MAVMFVVSPEILFLSVFELILFSCFGFHLKNVTARMQVVIKLA